MQFGRLTSISLFDTPSWRPCCITLQQSEYFKSFSKVIGALRLLVNGPQQGCKSLAVSKYHRVQRLRLQAFRDAYDRSSDPHTGSKFSRKTSKATRHRSDSVGESQNKQKMQSKDVTAILWLDHTEALIGTRKVLEINVTATCPTCEGTNQQSHVLCNLCCGSGNISCGGFFDVSCPACGGSGCSSKQWCSRCGGSGLTNLRKALHVKVPPGVNENSLLKLKGCGNVTHPSQAAGDLYVSFVVRARLRSRAGARELLAKIDVSYIDAILGSVYTVDTPSGPRKLLIPPGTQHGARLIADNTLRPLEDNTLKSRREANDVTHIFEVVLVLPVAPSVVEQSLLSQIEVPARMPK